MAVQGLRSQYKQSLFGYAWLFVNPLTQLATLAFVFSIIFKPQSHGHPFVIFLAVGLLPWNFFVSATLNAAESVVGSARIISSVHFPREFLVFSTVLVRLVDFGASLLILFVALVFYREHISWNAAWLPLIFFLQLLFTIGLALPLAALNLYFHDVRYLLGVLLNIWFFLTPIFYSTDAVPEKYRFLYQFNPLARFIGAYREALLDHGRPAASGLLLASLAALLSLSVGYYIFRRMEPWFADRV